MSHSQAVTEHEAVHVFGPLHLYQRPREAADEDSDRRSFILAQVAKAGQVPLWLHDQPPEGDVMSIEEVAVASVDQGVGPDYAAFNLVA